MFEPKPSQPKQCPSKTSPQPKSPCETKSPREKSPAAKRKRRRTSAKPASVPDAKPASVPEPPHAEVLRSRIREVYIQARLERFVDVEETLRMYQGREEELYRNVCKKYNVGTRVIPAAHVSTPAPEVLVSQPSRPQQPKTPPKRSLLDRLPPPPPKPVVPPAPWSPAPPPPPVHVKTGSGALGAVTKAAKAHHSCMHDSHSMYP